MTHDTDEGMTTVTDHTAKFRSKLVDELSEWKPFLVPGVAEAMRTVPRHLFLPDTPVEKVYRDMSVVTHRDSAGVATSSASAPSTVASMLQQAEVRPGHRVLEVGAGTGYNAALLAYLVGPTGSVSTVDIDAELTVGARRNLIAAGYPDVRVVCADGADGDPTAAPFDRIVVTAGAWDIPPAWLEQLAPDGRLVVPLRMRGLTRVVALERAGEHWQSVSAVNDGFVPLRGVGHQPERNITLDEAGPLILRIDDGQPVDADALRAALGGDPVQVWTGVRVSWREKTAGFGDLDYWLAGPSGLCRLLVRSPEHRIVAPALAYGSMVMLEDVSLAYLTKRPDDPASEYELGVCSYGPRAQVLADKAVELIRAWDTGRELPSRIELHPSGAPVPGPDEEILLMADKRHVRVVVRTMSAKA